MFQLKEFYQYKRELKKNNIVFQKKLVVEPAPRLYPECPNILLNPKCRGILYVKSSKSNTLVSLTNLKGRVQFFQSCGSLGFVGKKKRSTKFAVESTLSSVIQKAKEQGYTSLLIHLSGFSKARFTVLSCVKKYDIKIVGVRDLTPNPHNGCRPPKVRRI